MVGNPQSKKWVVYRMTAIARHEPTEVNVVCEQDVWEKLQRKKPGIHMLIREGIPTEEEAEKLARGTSGNRVPRRPASMPEQLDNPDSHPVD